MFQLHMYPVRKDSKRKLEAVDPLHGKGGKLEHRLELHPGESELARQRTAADIRKYGDDEQQALEDHTGGYGVLLVLLVITLFECLFSIVASAIDCAFWVVRHLASFVWNSTREDKPVWHLAMVLFVAIAAALFLAIKVIPPR